MKTEKMLTKTNPIINSDYPDPDIIRVGNVYYMASTTMHFMPGCVILRSYDLVNWEILSHAYETLENTPRYYMEDNQNIYGEGMWAPTFRYHKGTFYIVFTANDTHTSHLLTANDPAGPWTHRVINGWYYDSGLFFDDDDQVYIVHGQKTLHLTQLCPDLSGPLENGLDRIVAKDKEDVSLGYEGSHMYKKDGYYYIFTCHAEKGKKKTEDCFVSDSLTGEFRGKCIIDDDMGYHGLGVAQGGMVDTPDGEWYAFMFQDRGALGRSPMLMPLHFKNNYPVIGDQGKVPAKISVPDTGYVYEEINGNDDFTYVPDADGKVKLKKFWEFNHQSIEKLWSVTEKRGCLRMHSAYISPTLFQARNILTQRTVGPACAAEVTLGFDCMKIGDIAGICTFIGNYGLIGVYKKEDGFYLVMMGRPAKNETIFGQFEYETPGIEYESIPIDSKQIQLRVEADFTDKKDVAGFYYKKNLNWEKLGIDQAMYFKMDLFTGCRFGLFYYSTRQIGGYVDFSNFKFFKTDIMD